MRKRAFHIFGAALLTATATVVLSGPASAAPRDTGGYDSSSGYNSSGDNLGNRDRVTVNVEFRPSELKSGAGAEHVYRQIHNAALDACGDNGRYIHDLKMQVDMEQCENNAIADAVARINSPELTDIYDLSMPKHPLPSPG